VELLEQLELEPHLVHPSRCKAIASARLKNDKVDAAALVQLLRADLLPEAWIAPPATRDLRALRHRAALVRLSTSLKHRVHAVLADRGIGEDQSLWTGPGRAWLGDLELPPIPRAIVADCCGLLDALATPIARREREIGALAKPDPRVQALMVLPGVGKLTAMTLVAEIGDISRFPSARKLCAWAGLTPRVRNPNRKVRHGHSTKQGSPWVRGIVQEAAQTAKRHPRFAGAYAQLARRRGASMPPWRSPGGCWPARPYPDPAGRSIGEGCSRPRSRFRMRLQPAERDHNRLQAGLRAPVEQAIGHLANAWTLRRWRGLLYRVRDVYRAAAALICLGRWIHRIPT
jgi:transposase